MAITHDNTAYVDGGNNAPYSTMSMIKGYLNQYGIPTWIGGAIIQTESDYNPTVVGDGGKSFGLLQLYTGGGQGNGYSKEYLQNNANNLTIGLPPIKKAYDDGMARGLSGYALLEYTAGHSGHPSYNGTFTTGYQSRLKKMYENGDELTGTSPAPVGGSSSTEGAYKSANPSEWLTGDVSGLNSVFLGRLAALAKDNNRKISILSGHRSIEEQQQLYNNYKNGTGNLAAEPGKSRHNFGFAADVEGWAINVPESTYKQYGMHKPVKSPQNEPWHIEPIETQGLSSEELKTLQQNGISNTASLVANAPTKELNRNGVAKDRPFNEEEAGAYSLFYQMDEMATFKPFRKDGDGINGVVSGFANYTTENTKAFSIRFLIVFIGLLILAVGLLK